MNILMICYDYYYEYMCLNHDNHLAKDMEVAFLHLVSSSSEKSVSKQQATLLNFNDIRPTVVEWLKLALSSVWIFRSMEKPRSASALEDGIHRRPAISLNNLGNLVQLKSSYFQLPTKRNQHILSLYDHKHRT